MFLLRLLLFLLPVSGPATSLGEVDGGVITGNERENIALCTGQLSGGLVTFHSTSQRQDTNYFYVIATASEEPFVLEILDSTSFDFGPVALEEVRVYAISYTGNSAVVTGFPITLLPLSDACFALSDNYVTIRKSTPVAGRITTSDGRTELTLNLDSSTISSFRHTGDTIFNRGLVVTDTNNVIVRTVTGDTLDFQGADAGACRVWGAAYGGAPGIEPGQLLDTANNVGICRSISPNFVAVTRLKDPVSTSPPRGRGPGLRLEAYPNPVSRGLLTVTLVGDQRPAGQLRLLAGDGRPLTVMPAPTGSSWAIPVETLTPGIYVLAYATPAGAVLARFIKN